MFTNLLISHLRRPVVQTYLLAALFTIFTIGIYRSVFFTSTNLDSIHQQYAQSQYVLGDAGPVQIGDDGVYTYAADVYVKGEDPSQVNFEHPPLGKYIMGISLRLFGNPVFILLGFYFGCIVLVSEITRQLSEYRYAPLFAAVLFGCLALFRLYAAMALLDSMQLFFTLLLVWFLVQKKVSVLGVGLSLGLLVSVKYAFPTVALYGVLLAWKLPLKKLLQAIGVAVAVYVLSYVVYFLHHSPLEFVKFEWYRLNWYMGKDDTPNWLIFQSLFTGRFAQWWTTGYEYITSWSIVWPVLFLLSLLSMRKKGDLRVVTGYSLALLFLFGLGSAANERFFVHLVPFWIIAGVDQAMTLLESHLRGKIL